MSEEFTDTEHQPVENGNEAVENTGMVKREEPTPEEHRRAFVQQIIKSVKEGKKHHGNAFKQMFKDMELAKTGRDKTRTPDSHYIANIIQRHVKQTVSALYAKNPRAVARRRDRLDFQVWDEKLETLMMAQQTTMLASQQAMAVGVDPNDPTVQTMAAQINPQLAQAMMVLQDYQQGSERRAMLDRIAKTLEVLFEYSMAEQNPSFKSQMKQLVRRTLVTGVGYLKLNYQREMERRPDVTAKIEDVTNRIARVQRLTADMGDGALSEDEAGVEELNQALMALQNEEMMVTREGLLFDFPRSTTVIIDPKCIQLKGFLGAEWVAEEFLMSVDEVKEVYKVDVGQQFLGYRSTRFGNKEITGDTKKQRGNVLVWEFYHKPTGLVYVVADGYSDFLVEPAPPNVKLERFFPFYVLSFNDIEDDEDIYPPSDVQLMKDMQAEYNRARQGLREHRRANRPKYVTPAGTLEEEDLNQLKSHPANAVLELQAMQPGQAVTDVLQPVPTVGIDPNLYDTNFIFEDMLRVVGADDTMFGAPNSETATANAIADTARSSSSSSDIDDLDDMFTEVARDAGQVLMLEMDKETVMKIAGPGAVWPELTIEDVAQEIFLQIEAGSSGRPNRAQEIANMERLLPFLLQMPGINPAWLAKTTLNRMDDTLDLTDAVIDSAPSIISMNQQTQLGTGDPQTDPNQQGDQGQNNQENPDQSQQGPQALFGPPS